jgi:hypothetical protein
MSTKKELTDKEIEDTFIPKNLPVKSKLNRNIKKSPQKVKETKKIEKIIVKELEQHKKPIEHIAEPKTPDIIYTEKEKSYYDLNYFYLNRVIGKTLYFFSYKHYEKWFNETFNKPKIPLTYTKAEQIKELKLDKNEELYEESDNIINKLSDKQLRDLQDRLDKIRWLEKEHKRVD